MAAGGRRSAVACACSRWADARRSATGRGARRSAFLAVPAILCVGRCVVRCPPGSVPAPTGRTGQRSAFQAVPAILCVGRCVVRCPPGSGADRRSAFPCLPDDCAEWRYVVRGPAGRGAGPHRENWPEAGVPVPARHPLYGPRRVPLHGLPVRGVAALSGRDAGRRPPPGELAGAPLLRLGAGVRGQCALAPKT